MCENVPENKKKINAKKQENARDAHPLKKIFMSIQVVLLSNYFLPLANH